MKNYRLVEFVPENGERDGRKHRTTLYSGHDAQELQKAIAEWCKKPRKPFAEYACYHGNERIYEYQPWNASGKEGQEE